MGADRALDRRVGADIDKPAVAALPDLFGLTGIDLAGLDVGGERLVPLLVLLLDRGDHRKEGSDLVKAFLLGLGGHPRIHRGVLLVLAGGGHLQAGQGIGDLAVLHEELEPDFGVLLLVVGGLGEDGRDLLIALFLRLGGKVGVFVAGLALSCKSLPQILFGLAAFQFHCCALLSHCVAVYF